MIFIEKKLGVKHFILGDKLGEQNLHLYWADFENGLGQPNRIFRKVKIELLVEPHSRNMK